MIADAFNLDRRASGTPPGLVKCFMAGSLRPKLLLLPGFPWLLTSSHAPNAIGKQLEMDALPGVGEHGRLAGRIGFGTTAGVVTLLIAN